MKAFLVCETRSTANKTSQHYTAKKHLMENTDSHIFSKSKAALYSKSSEVFKHFSNQSTIRNQWWLRLRLSPSLVPLGGEQYHSSTHLKGTMTYSFMNDGISQHFLKKGMVLKSFSYFNGYILIILVFTYTAVNNCIICK